MADERRIVISSADHGLTADEIARRSFATAFRGFDAPEVRAFLKRVSESYGLLEDELRDLRRRLEDAQRAAAAAPAAVPVELDEDMLTTALGAETARVLRSAREAAADIQAKAEAKIARLVKEAEEDASRLRAEAESVLSRRVEEAEEVAAGIRRAAEADADAARARAKASAETEIEGAKARGRELLTEAHALREKVLGDLARRRKVAQAQVEQLRAGRERLLEAYRVVRRTLDEVTEELTHAEAEARLAAEAAGRRAAAEAEVSIEELEAELGATSGTSDAVGAPDAEPAGGEGHVPPSTDVAASVDEDGQPDDEATASDATPGGHGPPADAAPEASGPAAADVVALDERRSSSLRILRRPKERDEPVELPVVEPTAADEGVRIIRPDVSASGASEAEGAPVEPVEPVAFAGTVGASPDATGPQEPAPPEAVVAAAPDLAEAASKADIDSLFARIKADRAAAVAEAQAVLDARDDGGALEVAAPATPPAAEAVGDESVLQRRDALLEPVDAALVRRLKRTLQDDQNDALDRLRTAKGAPSVDAVLPDEAAHASRYRDVAMPILSEAAEAGAVFGGGSRDAAVVGSHADDLALELVVPLRDRLARGFEEAAAAGEDANAIVARVNAVYREWKVERLDGAARDAVATVFARNAFDALPDGLRLRWVVDDEDGPCPDCDDDALAGPTAKGEPFPTGQLHPPAHPGCRCVLVPAE